MNAPRTLAQIIIDALTAHPADVPICYVHENMQQVRTVKAGTKLTLGLPAEVFTPNDALWWTGQLGRSENRKPKYVGMLVFVPMADHEPRDK